MSTSRIERHDLDVLLVHDAEGDDFVVLYHGKSEMDATFMHGLLLGNLVRYAEAAVAVERTRCAALAKEAAKEYASRANGRIDIFEKLANAGAAKLATILARNIESGMQPLPPEIPDEEEPRG